MDPAKEPAGAARRRRAGQAAAEYAVAAAVLLFAALAAFGLARAVRDHGGRTVALASSEYP